MSSSLRRYYPIGIHLEGRPAVVVGGGVVAERKVARLLDYGALVTVVSPELCPGLQQLISKERFHWIPRKAEPSDLDGAVLVLVATGDEAVNASIAAAARERGVLVNRVDDAEDCDFIVPSIFTRGDLCVGVFSGGSAPALAKWLRCRLEGLVEDEMSAFAVFFARARRELGGSGLTQKERSTILNDLLGAGIYEVFRRDGTDAALEMVHSHIGRRRDKGAKA